MTQSRHRFAALLVICAAAFTIRIVMLGSFVHSPNSADPNHSYNFGVQTLPAGSAGTPTAFWRVDLNAAQEPTFPLLLKEPHDRRLA